VFFINVPIGLAAIALTARHVPAPDPRPRGLDPAAQLTGALALAALTLALIEGGHRGLTPLVVAAGGVLVAASAALVTIERRAAAPMLAVRQGSPSAPMQTWRRPHQVPRRSRAMRSSPARHGEEQITVAGRPRGSFSVD